MIAIGECQDNSKFAWLSGPVRTIIRPLPRVRDSRVTHDGTTELLSYIGEVRELSYNTSRREYIDHTSVTRPEQTNTLTDV